MRDNLLEKCGEKKQKMSRITGKVWRKEAKNWKELLESVEKR
jgi:hypothetical protein